MTATVDRISLTRPQLSVLEFVRDFYRREGYGPSVVEIMLATGVKSGGDVSLTLRKLVRLGLLRNVATKAGQSRCYLPIQLKGEPCGLCGCPGGH